MPPRAIQLSAATAAQVLAGHTVLAIGEFPAQGPSLDPGRPLLLLDPQSEAVATAVADPENDVVRILSRENIERFDEPFFRRRVGAAWRWRQSLGLGTAETSAYRLLNGAGDGVSGFSADVCGDYAVLYSYSRGLRALGRVLAQAICSVVGVQGVVLKTRPRHGAKVSKVQQEVIGDAPPEKYIVHESGIPYEVHLLGGLNVGLFTDMRLHRRDLHALVGDRHVLNLFSYTGSLSVIAARAGAKSVTSVDLAAGVHQWARKNFVLSELQPDSASYRFETSDVGRFLDHEIERGAHYDLVICDPPAVSAVRPSRWSMKNDYAAVIAASVRLLPDDCGGILWLAANARRGPALTRHIEDALRGTECVATVIACGGLPPECPTLLTEPGERYLDVVQLRVDARL